MFSLTRPDAMAPEACICAWAEQMFLRVAITADSFAFLLATRLGVRGSGGLVVALARLLGLRLPVLLL